jgi:transcriptional regulator with XRE-family HTH domain
MWRIVLFYAMAIEGKDQNSVYQSDEMMKKLGDRIRSLREKKGYSNYEVFAHEHNISRGQYWRYENGQNLRFSTLVKIVQAFGITLEEFFSEGFD